MSNFRPAGLSDEDSCSDDDYYDRPRRQYYPPPQSEKKKIENTLQEAIINNNLDEVDNIITNDLKGAVNIRLDSGWTPLMHACFHAQENIVNFLLDKGADPNLNADQVTPVMVACSNSSANNDTIDSIVRRLIDKNSLLNLGDRYGQTPLMRAIGSGRVALVQKLLDNDVNIEMRDNQGWTAVFWAVHHNQPEVLEMLITKGARLNEVDNSGRKLSEIAMTHDYQNVLEILNKHMEMEEDPNDMATGFTDYLSSWQDYYPGVIKTGRPDYISEIPHLLYGMSCEKLGGIIQQSGMDLRTFLLLEEKDLIELGIDLPFQRQRLLTGLHNFHRRGWKLKSVPGLYARMADHYTVLDCLTSVGSHLQQVYILEATVSYALKEYKRLQLDMKSKPPDEPVLKDTQTAAKKLQTTVSNIRKQIVKMRVHLTKISRSNPQPADLIKERTFHDIAKGYLTEAVIVCSLGLIAYQTKNYFISMFTK